MLDMWEHASYLQYRNVKADYVKAFWNIANCADVRQRFEARPHRHRAGLTMPAPGLLHLAADHGDLARPGFDSWERQREAAGVSRNSGQVQVQNSFLRPRLSSAPSGWMKRRLKRGVCGRGG
jgi:Iron/manganese superoxide dismutases, C-terminal domain